MCSPVNLLHIFRKPFLKNTFEWLLLDASADNLPKIKNDILVRFSAHFLNRKMIRGLFMISF